MNAWMWLFGLAAALFVCGIFAIIRFRLPMSGKLMVAASVVVGAVAAGSIWIPERAAKTNQVSARVDEDAHSEFLPRISLGSEFATSKACRKCHPGNYASWHASYHRTMTQLATPETVVGTFDNTPLRNAGQIFRFQRRGDSFWVTIADPQYDGGRPYVDRRILMTTGSHHMQACWISGPKEFELYKLPWFYHIGEQRWIPSQATFLVQDSYEVDSAQWNTVCLMCHATGGNPGVNPRTGRVETQVAELGISCESCHGGAAAHVRFHRRSSRKQAPEAKDPIVNPAKCAPRISSQICGQCHSYFTPVDSKKFQTQGFGFQPGEDLARTHKVATFDSARREARPNGPNGARPVVYWNDGTSCLGGDEYNGLVVSPCYQQGKLSCLSCHSMHKSDPNDQLAKRMDGNHACLQCHTSMRDRVEQHTHHKTGSSGSLCYNCHMPHTSYGLLKAIRSHRVVSPNAAVSSKSGRPNACNLCHLDKTLEWTGKHLSDWYGSPPPKLSQDEQQIAASLLWMLRGDAQQRVITAWHMGWKPAGEASGRDWQAPFLAQLLTDSYPVVRFVTFGSLRKLPHFKRLSYDFVGGAAEYQSRKSQVLQLWKRTRAGPIGKRGLLIGPDGKLRQSLIDRLVKQRDNRPIYLPE